MPTEEFKNLHFQLSKDDIKKLDRWKAARGMKSRSEAIRSMLRIMIKESPADDGFHKNSFSDNATSDRNGEDRAKKAQTAFVPSAKNMLREIIRDEILKVLNENSKNN